MEAGGHDLKIAVFWGSELRIFVEKNSGPENLILKKLIGYNAKKPRTKYTTNM
jgi:hypothetical protein